MQATPARDSSSLGEIVEDGGMWEMIRVDFNRNSFIACEIRSGPVFDTLPLFFKLIITL